MVGAVIGFALSVWGFVSPILKLLRLHWKPAAVLLAVMVFACALFLAVHERHRAEVAERSLADLRHQEAEAGKHTKRIETKQVAVSASADSHEKAAQLQIRTITQTIVREVPRYVTPATDARFPLPWSLLRVYDAAALSVDVSRVSLPAGQSDDQPSPVKASDAAAILAGNNGACVASAERLTALQAWVRAQQAAAATP